MKLENAPIAESPFPPSLQTKTVIGLKTVAAGTVRTVRTL